MYLSRLLLDPTNRQAQRETADPYNLHRTILKAFGSDRQSANILHRLEINPRSGQIILLVQSTIPPNWNWLAEKGYLLPPDEFSGLQNPAVKQANLSLHDGQILRFRLTANPTIKKVRRDDSGERIHSNRVPLVHEAKQRDWLEKRGDSSGFRIFHTDISQEQKQFSPKKKITVYTVQFNGRLQITDASKFQTAVQAGIGPAKAFGCGLLSLAPG